MKTILYLSLLIIVIGCDRDKTKPNLVYMPDMYYSVPYEPYSSNNTFRDSSIGLFPVKGTIKRGYMPYEIENSNEGYELSKSNTMPDYINNSNISKGKNLFTIYCSMCHGDKGDGNGILVQNEKILGVSSFSKTKLPDITEGSIFHVITYGKGIMGSHASMLSKEERWEIVKYVKELRKKLK